MFTDVVNCFKRHCEFKYTSIYCQNCLEITLNRTAYQCFIVLSVHGEIVQFVFGPALSKTEC